MSSRPRSATLGAPDMGSWLESGHAALQARLAALGPRPAGWRELSDALALGGDDWPRRAATPLLALHADLFDNAHRPREALALWRDAIEGATAARELAQAAGGSPATAGLAMLLRLAADALSLTGVAAAEARRGERLDAANFNVVRRAVAETAGAALLRHWRIAPAVAAAVRDAPAALERRAAGIEARAVHFAAVLVAASRSGFESPGLDGEMAAALQLAPCKLAGVRRNLAAQQGVADELLCGPLILGEGKAAG
ncbi:MAG: hypothetical protein R3E65_03700 [Steroidobacteraceae bacterium]